jgi:hypothetical protein
MKSGILLALVWVLMMAGCECPSEVQSHRGGEWTALPPVRPAASRDRVTYLGVQVVPAPAPIRAQLSLPEGAGLMVTGVAPGSPAAAANLARFDVLVRINQQYLINPEQLDVLVRGAKPGQEVRLTVIRQARLARVMVKLGSREAFEGPMGQGAPAHAMRGAPMGRGWGQGMDGRMGPGAWGQGMREEREGRPMPGGPWGPGMRDRDGTNEREEAEEEENEAPRGGVHYRLQKGPDGKMEIIPVPPGRDSRKGPGNRPGPGAQEGRESYKGEMVFQAREDGTLTQLFRDNKYALRLVTNPKGNKTLTARSVKDPKVVFEGPVNTPEERAKLTVPVRRRLEQIEKAARPVPPGKR